MKDFPMFTTEFGVASLILHEIPYRGEAFILIQDTRQPEELLAECVSFCRICGAEKIYVRGHEIAEKYPLHCIVYEMRGTACVDETIQLGSAGRASSLVDVWIDMAGLMAGIILLLLGKLLLSAKRTYGGSNIE